LHVILDVSRLLTVANRAAPTGIDRVELAYARHWLAAAEDSCSFVAELRPFGFAVLPRAVVADLVAALEACWLTGGRGAARAARRARLALPFGLGALTGVLASRRSKVFLLVSHRGLESRQRIRDFLKPDCAFVPLIHDLIPLKHPEFARRGTAPKHRARITTTAASARAVIVNSASTAQELAPLIAGRPGPAPIVVAPLGVSPPAVEPPAPGEPPYFVVLGTIEPRKNHLLLLELWRDFAARLGAAAPRLLVIGRRGWENDRIIAMLDDRAALGGLVDEKGALPDREVARLLRGARGLLFPSFAEGYGLPLAEALALGVPAICADIPALREVGGAVPDFLDPRDAPAWRDAILDYARPVSAARDAQAARLAAWQAPCWRDHFAVVERLIASLAARPAPARPPVPAVAAGARPA
jgi:glycosyltransferase involved in cell wall biosynthesis